MKNIKTFSGTIGFSIDKNSPILNELLKGLEQGKDLCKLFLSIIDNDSRMKLQQFLDKQQIVIICDLVDENNNIIKTLSDGNFSHFHFDLFIKIATDEDLLNILSCLSGKLLRPVSFCLTLFLNGNEVGVVESDEKNITSDLKDLIGYLNKDYLNIETIKSKDNLSDLVFLG